MYCLNPAAPKSHIAPSSALCSAVKVFPARIQSTLHLIADSPAKEIVEFLLPVSLETLAHYIKIILPGYSWFIGQSQFSMRSS